MDAAQLRALGPHEASRFLLRSSSASSVPPSASPVMRITEGDNSCVAVVWASLSTCVNVVCAHTYPCMCVCVSVCLCLGGV